MKLLLRTLTLVAVMAGTSLALRAQDAEGIYSKVDERPTPVKTVPPKYPSELKRDGISGIVAVQVVIDESGKVISTKVIKTTNADFDRWAIEAAEKWTFTPGKVGGKPVKMRLTVPFRFNAED